MLVRMNFKKNEIDKILKDAVIIVDTREQQNRHILEYFDKKKIKYKVEKLNYADYSICLPVSEYLDKEIYLNNVISIERKGSLEELSGNFTKDRARLEEEFQRSKGKIFLVIENSSFEDIVDHNYNTNFHEKSFVGTLKAFEARYNFNTSFIKDKTKVGEFIYKTLIYHAREYLMQ